MLASSWVTRAWETLRGVLGSGWPSLLLVVLALRVTGAVAAAPASTLPPPPANPGPAATGTEEAGPRLPQAARTEGPDESLLELERSSPEDPAITRARRLMAEGDFGAAAQALAPVLTASGASDTDDRVHARMLLGIAMAQTGRLFDAARLLNDLSVVRPSSAAIRLNLARTYAQMGRTTDAIAVLEKLAEARPDDLRTLEWLGALYLHVSRTSDAIRTLKRAAEAGASADTLYNLALAYQRAGDATSADAAYGLALQKAPDFGPALNNRGVLAFQQGSLQVAVDSLRKAVAVDPGAALYRVNLAAALRVAGLTQEAVSHLNRALEIDGPTFPVLLELGFAKLALRDFPGAVRQFDEASMLVPGHPDVLYGMGVALLAMGRAGDAAQTLRRSVQGNPANWRAWSGLGQALEETGDRAGAAAAYEQGVRQAPAQLELRVALGELRLREGRYRDAEQQFQAAVALGGASTSLLYGLGRAQLLDGRPEVAAGSFRRAADLEADLSRRALYLYSLALALEASGKIDAAVDALRQAVTADDSAFEAQLRLGELLLAGGKADQALPALRRAVELRPGDPTAQGALEEAKRRAHT